MIQPQSAWNVRLGRRAGGVDLDVLHTEANTRIDRIRRMLQNTHFEIQKMKKKFWGGATDLRPLPSEVRELLLPQTQILDPPLAVSTSVASH